MHFKVTFAKPSELDILVEHRLGMWKDIHPELAGKTEKSRARTRRWISEKLSKGELVGFVAKSPDGTPAGSGCIWLREEQPRPDVPFKEVPYLLSMYTKKEFRRQGVAKEVLKAALKWTREHKYSRVVLHASSEGRRLYKEFGFKQTREMRLDL